MAEALLLQNSSGTLVAVRRYLEIGQWTIVRSLTVMAKNCGLDLFAKGKMRKEEVSGSAPDLVGAMTQWLVGD